MKVQFKKQITLLALALALTAAGSCTRVYPVRTLPSWVRGIYIPMVMNKTTEPGIEEIATRQVQEEFMADGRVNVVPKSQADLQLVAVIKSFRTQVDSYDNDRIARRKEVLITSELKLYDPEVDPFKPDQEPIANLGTILTRYRYSGDLRSVNVLTEDERNDDAFKIWARQVLNQTITGFPTELKGSGEGTKLPQPKQPDRGLQGDILQNKKNRF